MPVWRIAIESQQDALLGHDSWARFQTETQQSGRPAGILRPAPDRLTSRNLSLASKETTRCSTLARDNKTKILHDFRRESQELLWLNKPADALDMQMEEDSGASKSSRGLAAECATAETVTKLCDEGNLTQAVEALGVLVQADSRVSKSLLYTLLKKCGARKDLVCGRRVHALTVKLGYQSDTFLCNHILRMYASHGRMQDAMDVFTSVANPDAFMWSSIISAHVKQGQDKQAIQLYHQMRRSSEKADGHVFVAALQACARGLDLETGQQVHADVLASGVQPDLYVSSCLVDMYAKCGNLKEAQRAFDGLCKKDVVTWTAMIAGYSQQGMGQEALLLFMDMQAEGIAVPNSVTFLCLLQACASVGPLALEKGKQVHAQIRARGYQVDASVANSLVNMYAKCGSLEDAQNVFDGLAHKDVVTWTALIAGYSQQDRGQEALRLYRAMQEEAISVPNSVTFVCLLQACASVGSPALEMGKHLHTQIEGRGHGADMFVAGSLLNMYAKCGSLKDAQRVFDGLLKKDVVTWNSMITGYSQQGMGQEALRVYSVMEEEGISVPNSVTFVCVLQACASVGIPALEMGKQFHAQIRDQGLEANLFVANSLVNMYAKCGSLDDAQIVFDGLGERDVVTWTALLAGYSQQGRGQEALHLYSVMQEEGMAVPNSETFACLLQACASVGTAALERGKQLHAQISNGGHQADVFVGSSLVNMYAKCGSLKDARRVFDALVQKDVVTWTALIVGYSQQGMGHEALHIYKEMQQERMAVPNSVTFGCLLQACASVGSPAMEMGMHLHTQVCEQGYQADAFVASSLVNMYGKCGSLEDGEKAFDRLGQRDVVTRTALIAGYSKQGMGQEALRLYRAMQEEGMAIPNPITFVCLLQACASLGSQALEMGKQLHAKIRERGHEEDVIVANSLVNMYAKCGSLEDAQRVFDGLVHKNVVTWNAMIAGYSQLARAQEALCLYGSMQEDGVVEPNAVTFSCLLHACASVGTPALKMGKDLHVQIKERGYLSDVFVASSLIDMYAKCGNLEDAQIVFDVLGQKDVVTWNAMISAYSQQGMGQEALCVYVAMEKDGLAVPNPVTFMCALQACATVGTPALEKGKQLHAKIREGGYQVDDFVASSLVNMYAKCGSLQDAESVLDGLALKAVATRSALIASYSQQGMGQEALRLYSAMQEDGMAVSDSLTFMCLLQACADVAALHLGRQLHAQMVEQGLPSEDLFAACTLINMYGKCGSMLDAQQVFDALPEKNLVAWNAFIAGYSHQGDSEKVFALVRRMTKDGIQPDGITFLAVLTVCSHTGLVSKGREYFDAMSKDHTINPTVQHYTCMVDLLGRAGRLDEALALVKTMPVPPDAAVWHTLLGACQKWTSVEAGQYAFDQAVKLDKENVAAYVLMSNIYTAAQMWEQAQELQARRKRVGAEKQPGQSWWTDMDGLVHSFLVGD